MTVTPIRVLIADNDPKWLADVADFLVTRAGFSVILASSFDEAKMELVKNEADIALIDIRLLDEDDPVDISGMTLARNYAVNMPKIIVTAYPTFKLLRDALKRTDGLPASIDFFGKKEGKAALVIAINNVMGSRTKAFQEGDLIFGPGIREGMDCDVFVIMPFADQFDDIARLLTDQLANSLHLNIKRGDDFFGQNIMNDVWSAINAAKLLIAECTGRNPNVFYELGIAHALGKPVILITQEKDIRDIPFDIRHMRTYRYENTPQGHQELLAKLIEAIRKLGFR